MSDATTSALARLATQHAEPEIATHLAVFTDTGPLLEWFDAPDDPVAIAGTVPQHVVQQFAAEAGGTCEEMNEGV